jgi:tetratricopeptide (TPR) repeat protein
MGRRYLLGGIILMLCLIFLKGTPLCFASGVDAANAGIKAASEGDKEKAKVLFRSALKSNELSKRNYILVNNHLCEILGSESKIDPAIDCYSETLYLDTDNFQALLSRGRLYALTSAHEKAIEDFSRYIRLSPTEEVGYTQRAVSLRALKKFDLAISDQTQAIRLMPQKHEGFIHRGNTYLETGNYNLAQSDFERAVSLDPQSSWACQALAWFYATCREKDFRNPAAALKFAQKSLVLAKDKPLDPGLYETLAAAYAASGQFHQAVETQKKAMARLSQGKRPADASDVQNRLDLYRNGKSYTGM